MKMQNREFKFRAYVQDYLPHKEAATMVYSEHVGSVGFFFNNFEGEPIMQFTGLLDANGVEIYEGDVVSIWGRNLKIEFDESDASFFAVTQDYTICESGQEWGGNCKVIGNIYENPELLEDEDAANS
jgi:uncharacterized phage protein (TIGR01671 family)